MTKGKRVFQLKISKFSHRLEDKHPSPSVTSALPTGHRATWGLMSPRENFPMGRAALARCSTALALRTQGWQQPRPHIPALGRTHTYHFIIDFVEVDFADFFHHIFIFKSNETKSCSTEEQKGEGERKTLARSNSFSSNKALFAIWTLECFHRNMPM